MVNVLDTRTLTWSFPHVGISTFSRRRSPWPWNLNAFIILLDPVSLCFYFSSRIPANKNIDRLDSVSRSAEKRMTAMAIHYDHVPRLCQSSLLRRPSQPHLGHMSWRGKALRSSQPSRATKDTLSNKAITSSLYQKVDDEAARWVQNELLAGANPVVRDLEALQHTTLTLLPLLVRR